MIYGIGTDLCDLRRMAAAVQRRGGRFAERILGPSELQIYNTRRARSAQRGLAFLATRFSAKEAFAKAIGLGLRQPMTWRDCEILPRPSGQPTVRLHGKLAAWFEQHRLTAHVSLSDEADIVASFVVVETTATEP